jgi:uncharacterized protein YuzE
MEGAVQAPHPSGRPARPRSVPPRHHAGNVPHTDSLYIDLSEQPRAESREISEGVVLDYDVSGNLVGIDTDNAGTKVDLHGYIVNKIPASVETIAG